MNIKKAGLTFGVLITIGADSIFAQQIQPYPNSDIMPVYTPTAVTTPTSTPASPYTPTPPVQQTGPPPAFNPPPLTPPPSPLTAPTIIEPAQQPIPPPKSI